MNLVSVRQWSVCLPVTRETGVRIPVSGENIFHIPSHEIDKVFSIYLIGTNQNPNTLYPVHHQYSLFYQSNVKTILYFNFPMINLLKSQHEYFITCTEVYLNTRVFIQHISPSESGSIFVPTSLVRFTEKPICGRIELHFSSINSHIVIFYMPSIFYIYGQEQRNLQSANLLDSLGPTSDSFILLIIIRKLDIETT